MSVVLDLMKDDVVNVVLDSGKLLDSQSLHYTQFSGYLIKQQVAFSAYRNSDVFSSTNVTYDGAYINVGNGLDISSGKFKAPMAGTYAVHFNALSADTYSQNNNYIELLHNGITVGASFSNFDKVKFSSIN